MEPSVPLEVLPPDERHRTLYATWAADGEEHKKPRGSLRSINRGSTPEARAFTRERTRMLLGRLLQEKPPWDLSRVIDTVSMEVVIRHTLQAPPLLPYARRLRELTRDNGAAPGGFLGITRQPEAEDILRDALERRDALPQGGLARYLVDLYQAGGRSIDQLVGQLWLVAVSFETQATGVSSLLGMLLEFDELGYARSILDEPELMKRLVDEGGRRSIVFPASLLIATKPFTLDGMTVPTGTPCLVSYAALDPAKFENPERFDPRLQRNVRHIAFGEGGHRCQGEVGGEQFIGDVLSELVRDLPADARLHKGLLLRETGISMSVACLPVTSPSA
jgi:biflaviolin synthase